MTQFRHARIGLAAQHADDMLDAEPLTVLGEGYHVMALVEPARRFVVKYAKSRKPVPPLGADEN